jgi:hypothetical protein
VLGKYCYWIKTLVMQESGLQRYTTLTVGREKSLYSDMHVQSHVSAQRECRLRYAMDRRHIDRNRFAPSSPRNK